MASPHSPVFRKSLKSIRAGEILAPALRAYLYDPNFKGFDVKVRGIGTRKPDGWFHPSEHPAWSDRALYLYLTTPEVLITQPMDPLAVLSMTAGSIWHAIVGRILCHELGLVKSLEVSVRDEDHGTKGHMDGLMTDEIYELKTMKDMALGRIESVEDYLTRYPGYHVQANEYMRMSGYRRERVLLMALTYPYDMREFVIDYDPALAHAVKEKYARVRQAAADQRMPRCDGCLTSAECPARALCDHLKLEGK